MLYSLAVPIKTPESGILRLRRVAVAALFPTAAGIGSLSECNELSEQALFRVAILRKAVSYVHFYFIFFSRFFKLSENSCVIGLTGTFLGSM